MVAALMLDEGDSLSVPIWPSGKLMRLRQLAKAVAE